MTDSLVFSPQRRPSLVSRRVGSCVTRFGACAAFTHITACMLAKSAITGQCLLIFHSVGFEFAYFGEDLCEPIGEPVKALTVVAVRERAAEDLQRML